MALPGIAGSASAAEVGAQEFRASYGFSYYLEDELDDDVLATGSGDRYEIEMHQFRLEAPLTGRLGAALDVTYETMSGATPWYVAPDANGDPVQVMTGATIQEERTDTLLTTNYQLSDGTVSSTTGFSTENDYLSFNAGLAGDLNFNEKNTTVSLGSGFSLDFLEPTDGGSNQFPTRPEKEDKQSFTISAGVAQVLGEKTAIQTSGTYQLSRGFLSDPYKQVLVAGAPLGDTRPDLRHQFSWLTRLRHHFDAIGATVHADYQLYADDWGILSHTAELAWYQSLFEVLQLVPSFRYYSQSQADFYAPWFVNAPSDGLYSSDYRLSPYGAISWKLKAQVEFRTWRLGWIASAGWERYLSSGDFALGKVSVEAPGLVNWNLYSVSLTGRF